jgi:hypothetical protein
MHQLIDWNQVATDITPTKVFIAIAFYLLVRGIVKLIRISYKVFLGWWVSDERRMVFYIHHRNNHKLPIKYCQSGECMHLYAPLPDYSKLSVD